MKPFRTVLVIDDDPVMRAMAQDHFERRGATQVLHAGNGEEALQILHDEGQHIDLVLSDINMPTLDGVELMRRMNDCDYGGPIVIVSGTYDVVVRMAQELGHMNSLNVIGTLTKPFDSGELDRLVAAI